MPKNMALSLEELSVKSFITDLSDGGKKQTIVGLGNTSFASTGTHTVTEGATCDTGGAICTAYDLCAPTDQPVCNTVACP